MPSNRYHVPIKRWRKWSDHARQVFNDMYKVMSDQHVFSHPKAKPMNREQWTTVRWNAAWMAADLANGAK